MVKYILFTSAILLSSCLKDDELSLKRKDNNTDSLKLNGYFYNEYGTSSGFAQIYFLYRNGIILYGLSHAKNDLASFESKYIDGSFYTEYSDNKDIWGVYELKDNVVKFERWYPSERPYQTAIREGEILNDTTFVITKSYRSNGSNLTERNEVYKFKSFSPKPDSTNVFIK